MDISAIQQKLRDFAAERNWDQFHSPKNLAMALAGEAGELLELFQWLTEEESTAGKLASKDLYKIREELADILLYLIRIGDKLSLDLEEAAWDKIRVNETKYPVNLSRDNAVKYNRRNG